jgi:UDP-glucose 4-epimerase
MNLMREHIFITGGAGFMGSTLSPLLAAKTKVTVYDQFVGSSVVSQQWLQERGIESVKGDIRDEEKITKAMKGHTVVLALAAAHLRVSLAHPVEVHDVNSKGNLVTLLAAKKNKVKRVAYISSSEIYGSATDKKMTEEHKKNPTTVYGVSKYIGELYSMHFHHHEGVPGLIIRPFNTYGPRSHWDGFFGEVIPRMTIRALNGLPPMIFGDGSQSRDFTYITDIVDGIIAAASCDELLGDAVNIAYGQEVSVKTIVEAILSSTNPKLKPIRKDARPNDVARHAADTKKAQKLFGWKPKIDIQTGIKQYVSWVKENYTDTKKLLELIPEKNW